MFTRFSLPSSVNMIPQYKTRPFSGILLYNFSFCWVDVIAPKTDNLQKSKCFFERFLVTKKMSYFASLLKRCSRRNVPIHARFDIRCCAILVCKHLHDPRDLIFGRNHQRNHAGSSPIMEKITDFECWLHSSKWLVKIGAATNFNLLTNPLACCRLFISFFTFHNSTCLSWPRSPPSFDILLYEIRIWRLRRKVQSNNAWH